MVLANAEFVAINAIAIERVFFICKYTYIRDSLEFC